MLQAAKSAICANVVSGKGPRRFTFNRKATSILAIAASSLSVAVQAQTVLPAPEVRSERFEGRTFEDSSPHWPQSREAPEGAPNVLLILTDDVGFGATSAYGGPVPTPNFDKLAKEGLRYTQYNNAAICSATRAALLTGRNEHAVGMGTVTNAPSGYPGYTSIIPKSAGTVAEVLKQHGFSTAAIGKWHLTPEWEESHVVGPFDRWPTGMGFEYYYGFIGADTDQFAPSLTVGTTPIEAPQDPNYILDRDLADRAITWIRQQEELAPNKPFFMYYATGSTHAPHHAPADWIAKFKGQFDDGWDIARERIFRRQKQLGIIPEETELTPRPAFIPSWDSLTQDQKRVNARLMEAFAAQLAFADAQIGRVIAEIERTGQKDNTLIVFVQGDNGASSEGASQGSFYEQAFINQYDEPFEYMLDNIDKIGGPDAYNNYPTGWGWATNAPFQYFKQTASHFGGLRDGMVMSWPKVINDQGGLRTQFHYVTDIVPTIYEAVGIEAPARLNGVDQMPLDGISMSYTFDAPEAPSNRQTQVFEIMQNLGIYHKGWWAGTTPVKQPWEFFKVIDSGDPNDRQWQLYHVAEDYSQSKNLAAEMPGKLAEMQQIFWAEAARNKILPIHGLGQGVDGAPDPRGERQIFTYTPGLTRVPPRLAPETLGNSYRISADIEITEHNGEGVIVAHGGKFGGYSFYMKENRLVFHYNAIGERQFTVAAAQPLDAGKYTVGIEFVSDEPKNGSGGTVTLLVDGKRVGTGRVEATMFAKISLYEGFDVGEDKISPVTEVYTTADSKFQGVLRQVRFSTDD